MKKINYEAWATNAVAFIRKRGLELEFTDWCGGWACPIPEKQQTQRQDEEPALAGDEATAEQQIASLTHRIASLQSTIDVRDATILSLEADREFMVQELGRLLEKLGKKDLAG